MTRPHIRWMIRRDMAEVLDIERESYEFPWSEEDFIRCLRQRNCIGMVAEYQERVIGFMIYELHKTRLDIIDFAVAKAKRRKNVGRSMVDKLKSKLSLQRRTNLSLVIGEKNLDGQLFFKSLDFRAKSILENHFKNPVQDGYLMKYYLDDVVPELDQQEIRNRINKYCY